MNQKFILALLVGTVVQFFGGWLVYGIALRDFAHDHTVQYTGLLYEMPKMLPVILGNIIWSFFIVWVFQKWANVTSVMKGLTTGALITLLIALSGDLLRYSMMNLYDSTYLIVDVIASIVLGAVTGALIGWVLGMGDKSQTA